VDAQLDLEEMVDPNYEEIKVYAQNKGKYYALVEVAVLA